MRGEPNTGSGSLRSKTSLSLAQRRATIVEEKPTGEH
jgi:hypothetical protein